MKKLLKRKWLSCVTPIVAIVLAGCMGSGGSVTTVTQTAPPVDANLLAQQACMQIPNVIRWNAATGSCEVRAAAASPSGSSGSAPDRSVSGSNSVEEKVKEGQDIASSTLLLWPNPVQKQLRDSQKTEVENYCKAVLVDKISAVEPEFLGAQAKGDSFSDLSGVPALMFYCSSAEKGCKEESRTGTQADGAPQSSAVVCFFGEGILSSMTSMIETAINENSKWVNDDKFGTEPLCNQQGEGYRWHNGGCQVSAVTIGANTVTAKPFAAGIKGFANLPSEADALVAGITLSNYDQAKCTAKANELDATADWKERTAENPESYKGTCQINKKVSKFANKESMESFLKEGVQERHYMVNNWDQGLYMLKKLKEGGLKDAAGKDIPMAFEKFFQCREKLSTDPAGFQPICRGVYVNLDKSDAGFYPGRDLFLCDKPEGKDTEGYKNNMIAAVAEDDGLMNQIYTANKSEYTVSYDTAKDEAGCEKYKESTGVAYQWTDGKCIVEGNLKAMCECKIESDVSIEQKNKDGDAYSNKKDALSALSFSYKDKVCQQEIKNCKLGVLDACIGGSKDRCDTKAKEVNSKTCGYLVWGENTKKAFSANEAKVAKEFTDVKIKQTAGDIAFLETFFGNVNTKSTKENVITNLKVAFCGDVTNYLASEEITGLSGIKVPAFMSTTSMVQQGLRKKSADHDEANTHCLEFDHDKCKSQAEMDQAVYGRGLVVADLKDDGSGGFQQEVGNLSLLCEEKIWTAADINAQYKEDCTGTGTGTGTGAGYEWEAPTGADKIGTCKCAKDYSNVDGECKK